MHAVRIVDHVSQQWPSMRIVVTEIGRGCDKFAGHDLGGESLSVVSLVVLRVFCRRTGLRSTSRWTGFAVDKVYTESSCAEDRWI